MSFAFPKNPSGFRGYVAEIDNASPEYLSSPSVNCLIDEQGVAETRLGFEDTGYNLNNANKAHTSFYMSKYDITFFAGGTKVFYIDWNYSTPTVVDTGITLTTGLTTRFAEFGGDIYLTNTTDGMRRIVVMRLNDAAATSGDANVTVDFDGAARLSVFGIGATGNLRINGTNEAYNATVISTGVITLVSTLSQTYADNTIAIRVHDISGVTGIEKASKVFFWKRRLGMLGSEVALNADQPNSTIYYGKFASTLAMETIIVFDYATGGSVAEMVGVSGRVTNAVPVKDFLYQFTNEESYVTAAGDIVLTGTGIGITTPDIRDEEHGCINEDCAVSTGNNEIAYVTLDNRIMRIKLADSNGAAIVYPDDEFDRPMRKILSFMDTDQTGAIVYRHKKKRRTYFQLKISSQWVTLCFDRTINAWQPPQTGKAFKSVFERKGVLYATDINDDSIYRLDSTFNDNNIPFETYIATGVINLEDSTVDKIVVKGKITQSTTIGIKVPVDSAALDNVTAHTITGTSFSYGTGLTLGSTTIGSTSIGADQEDSADYARFKRVFDVFPSEASRAQIITFCLGDSAHYGISSIQIQGRSLPTSKNR